MGAIKDVADLVTQLVDRVEDRKFAADLLAIQSMIGGIISEQVELHERNIELMRETAELTRTIDSLRERVGTLESAAESAHVADATPVEPLSEEEEQILRYVAHNDGAILGHIARAASLDEVTTEYWLDKLCDREMVSQAIRPGGPNAYYLGRSGREHLVENAHL